jgi:hypothetical protein
MGRPKKEELFESVCAEGKFDASDNKVRVAFDAAYKEAPTSKGILKRVLKELKKMGDGRGRGGGSEKEGSEEGSEEASEQEEDEETAEQRETYKQRAMRAVADLAEELFGEGRLWADEQMKPLQEEKLALEEEKQALEDRVSP